MELLIGWVLLFTACGLGAACMIYMFVRCVEQRDAKKYIFISVGIAAIVVMIILYVVLAMIGGNGV